ncbi:MAG: serine/threonine protein kinase, partial [Proteobacteria bacterium]
MGKAMKKKFGHYEVISELGRGGMGVVYKAFEPTLNRYVAIKALGEHLLNDEDLIERFTREAKSMAAINHPNVIQVYYIGKEDKQPFFAMEFLEGISLDELLTGHRILQLNDAKNILRQACAGLNEAHKHDLVHRDIKPANLMICTDGSVKVVDFGIAQTREYGDKLTNTGEFVGTPGYLSPEVCTGQEVDKRSDIFALGIVFYEMLAGKVPFENDSPLGLMLEVVQSEIPDIRGINKKVDKKTHYILEKMIAKNPRERFQDCAEIIQQLGPGGE